MPVNTLLASDWAEIWRQAGQDLFPYGNMDEATRLRGQEFLARPSDVGLYHGHLPATRTRPVLSVQLGDINGLLCWILSFYIVGVIPG